MCEFVRDICTGIDERARKPWTFNSIVNFLAGSFISPYRWYISVYEYVISGVVPIPLVKDTFTFLFLCLLWMTTELKVQKTQT
jgi:hypothetical protein